VSRLASRTKRSMVPPGINRSLAYRYRDVANAMGDFSGSKDRSHRCKRTCPLNLKTGTLPPNEKPSSWA